MLRSEDLVFIFTEHMKITKTILLSINLPEKSKKRLQGNTVHFVSLGLFIIDEFKYLNPDGSDSGRTLQPQVKTKLCTGTGGLNKLS